MIEKDLQKNLSPEELESLKIRAMAIYDEIVKLDKEAREIVGRFSKYPDIVQFGIKYIRIERKHNDTDRDIYNRELDSMLWQYFFGSGKLQEIMDVKSLEKFNDMLRDPEPFSAERARMYIANSMDIASDALNTLAKTVFNHLISATYRPGGSGNWRAPQKKHNNLKVEKTFRLSESVYRGYTGRWEASRYRPAIFNDLEKICSILGKQSPPKYPQTIQDKMNTDETSKNEFSNEYFTVTLYKNGNQKVKFLRDDILELLNRYGQSGGKIGHDVKVEVFGT